VRHAVGGVAGVGAGLVFLRWFCARRFMWGLVRIVPRLSRFGGVRLWEGVMAVSLCLEARTLVQGGVGGRVVLSG